MVNTKVYLPKWNLKLREAPFDLKGNLLSYDRPTNRIYKDVTHVFPASLMYTGIGKGRSSVVVHWRDTKSDCAYNMFISDFDDLIMSNRFVSRLQVGWWRIVKKGMNYGIQYVEFSK